MMTRKRPKLQVLLVIPLFVLLLGLLIPSLYTLLISFQENNPMFGQSGGMSMDGYRYLFTSPEFYAALRSTLVQSLLPAAVGILFALLGALLLPRVSVGARGTILLVLLFFSFLPTQLYSSLIYMLRLNLYQGIYTILMAVMNIFPTVGFAALVGGGGACLAGNDAPARLRLSGVLVYGAICCTRMLSTNLDGAETIAGPAGAGTTLYQLEYKQSLLHMQFANGAAIRVVANLLQLLPGIAALLVFALLMIDRRGELPAQRKTRLSPSFLVCLVGGAGLFLVALGLSIWGEASMVEGLLRATMVSLAIMVLGGALFAVMAAPGAVAAASFRRPMVAALFLLFGSISCGLAAPMLLGMRLGMINNILMPAFGAAMELLPLVACISWFFYLDHTRALRYALPLAGLALHAILNNVGQQLLFISSNNLRPLTLQIRYLLAMQYRFSSAGVPLLVLAVLSLALWLCSSSLLFVRET